MVLRNGDAWRALGAALRREAAVGGGPLTRAAQGTAVGSADLRDALGARNVEALERDGLLDVGPDGTSVVLRERFAATADFAIASPEWDRRPDLVYLGPDSNALTEAALRLAPSGARACDLGTGTGLLAAVLSLRYRLVVATDIVPRVAAAARRTMLLNDRPKDHVWTVIRSDVAGGLRPGSFDLVTANAPWVPSGGQPGRGGRIYADGGRDGVELPIRFLSESASLLRPGGVAITLALHVTKEDGVRPLGDASEDLERAGFTAAMIPTPLNTLVSDLSARILSRAPGLSDALHVAVVVGAPGSDGGRREALVVACAALARRWGTRTLAPDTLAS